MPFAARCASEPLHKGWNIDQSQNLRHMSKILKPVVDRLLQLSHKSIASHYHKESPKFCEKCITKVTELYPELKSETKQPEELDDESSSKDVLKRRDASQYDISSKKVRLSETPAIANSKQTQTEGVFIDMNDLQTLQYLDNVQISQLAYALGKLEHNKLKHEGLLLSNERTLDEMLNINLVDYMKQRNRTVVSFLLGIKDADETLFDELETVDNNAHMTSVVGQQGLFLLCKSVESILNLTAPNLLLPLHFRDSIVMYSLTHSRLSMQVLCGGGPHGSYQAVKEFLCNLGTEETLNVDQDIVVAFDNNQILHRQWHVDLQGKFKCHIVTMVAMFNINSKGKVQWKSELKPGMWFLKDNEKVQQIRLIDQDQYVKKLHYEKHLYPYLTDVIVKVAQEQENTENTVAYTDEIDAAVENNREKALYKECFACGEKQIPKNKINCPACKKNLKQSRLQALGLADVGTYEEHTRNIEHSIPQPESYRIQFKPSAEGSYKMVSTKVEDPVDGIVDKNDYQVAEPVFVNPCSYASCETILRHIGRKSGIRKYGKGERQWLCICCDGSPYVLCLRVMYSTYMCNLCGSSVSGIDEQESHSKSEHPDQEENVVFDLEFDWVLLIPGPGHVEMNMLRSVVELCWEVFWKELVQLMNFRSENAQRAAKRVNDHHKGWQLLTIARNALAKELVLPFVRKELGKDNPDLTVVNFMRFISRDVKDKNYLFMTDIVFEFLEAIIMYRNGVRTDDFDMMMAARGKFGKLWFGRHHPNYREIEIADSIMLARMPTEAVELVKKAISLNTTGRKGTNEGPDFKLEEINKQTQQWIPKVPSGEDWRTVCNNYNSLKQLREVTFDQFGIKDPKIKGHHKQRDMSKEERAFRVLLRERHYLSDPSTDHELVSLSGTPLDPNLIGFSASSRIIRAKYFDAYRANEAARSLGRKAVPFKEDPIFVTTEEREQHNALSSRTISELKIMIAEKISMISASDVMEAFEETYQAQLVRNRASKKQDYLDFFDELTEYLQNESLYSQIADQLELVDSDEES